MIHRHGVPDPTYRQPFGSEWIRKHWATLPDKEWVAADDGGFVAADPTYTGLLARLRDRHKNPGDVVVTFVDKWAV